MQHDTPRPDQPHPATSVSGGEIERVANRVAVFSSDEGGNMPTTNDAEISFRLGDIRALLALATASQPDKRVEAWEIALTVIANWPVTDPDDQDAHNMAKVARDTLALPTTSNERDSRHGG